MPLVEVEVYNFRGAIWIVDFCKAHPILCIIYGHQLGIGHKTMERKVSYLWIPYVHASLTVYTCIVNMCIILCTYASFMNYVYVNTYVYTHNYNFHKYVFQSYSIQLIYMHCFCT